MDGFFKLAPAYFYQFPCITFVEPEWVKTFLPGSRDSFFLGPATHKCLKLQGLYLRRYPSFELVAAEVTQRWLLARTAAVGGIGGGQLVAAVAMPGGGRQK